MKKYFLFIVDFIVCLFLVFYAFIASWAFFLWSGYPQGGDAPQHLSRLVYVLTFPNSFSWYHVWAGGVPQFLRYPSFPYVILSFIIRLTRSDPAFVLSFAAVFCSGLVALGVYLLILFLSKKRIAAFLSAFLFLSTPASYNLIRASVYARQLALPLLVFTFVFFIRYWRSLVNNRFSKADFILTILFLGGALTNHFAIGLTSLALIILTGLLTTKNLKSFIKGILFLVIPALFLSAVFWLPVLSFPISGFITGSDVLQRARVTNPWTYLFYIFDPENIYYFQVNTFILPFILTGSLLFFGFIFLLRKRYKNIDFFEKRILLLFLLFSLLTVLYAQISLPFLALFYSNIWPTLWILLFSAFFISLSVGLLFSWVISSRLISIVVASIIIFTALGWIQTQYPVKELPQNPVLKAMSYSVPKDTPYNRFDKNTDSKFYNYVAEKVVADPNQTNYRFGTGNFDHMARWFNILYPYVPQTREYYFIAVVNPDSYFHLIQAVWNTKDNYNETNFLLNWWGVRQFIVGEEDEKERVPGKFKDREEIYKYLGSFQYSGVLPLHHRYDAFEYTRTTPIVYSTNAPTLIVIGDKISSYNTVYRSLSFANINSNKVIPIEGGEYIDDYKLSELKKFTQVFLYNYKYKDFDKANMLLKQYVEEGGKLFVEENKNSEKIFEVVPVVSISKKERENDWSFNLNSPPWNKFSEPKFDQGPWTVVAADGLKENAQVIVKSSDEPLIVEGNYGKGKVIWSGINLPFHIIYNQNEEESKLIARLLGVDEELDRTKFDYQFINPQNRKISILGPAKGVLFKEFYFSNWRSVISKEKLNIYKAGPGFMYVFLPENIESSSDVYFTYKQSSIEIIAKIISILSLVILILYGLEGKIIPPVISALINRLPKFSEVFNRKFASWWDKEE